MTIKDMAARAGEKRGRLDAYIRKSCDPRGRFIAEPLFHETEWAAYRDAYDEAYRECISAQKEVR